MHTLTLRIYLTVVAVLLLFAVGSGWVVRQHIEGERTRVDNVMMSDRMSAWAELIQRALPPDEAPPLEQAAAVREWSIRLRLPLALDSAKGERIAESDSFTRRQSEGGGRAFAIPMDDGRTLWLMRGNRLGGPPGARMPADAGQPPRLDRARDGRPPPPVPFVPAFWQRGVGVALLLLILFVAVALGAWPVVRRLTRRLQSLKQGVEVFGSGQLSHRVAVNGRDEVTALAQSFNAAAARIESLVKAHQSLLANASHELRSPLARMKMAVSMLDEAPPAYREKLRREIDTNVAELDALVEEVLLASRLDARPDQEAAERVDLLGLAAEEAARIDAAVEGESLILRGEERLLRRALRNLIENARRYGGGEVSVRIERAGGQAVVRVCDRGPGVPAELRERIFEPFYRLPGHAEQAGGVGLGLSLVKQIAERHGGRVRCEAREGGGSCFVFSVPLPA